MLLLGACGTTKTIPKHPNRQTAKVAEPQPVSKPKAVENHKETKQIEIRPALPIETDEEQESFTVRVCLLEQAIRPQPDYKTIFTGGNSARMVQVEETEVPKEAWQVEEEEEFEEEREKVDLPPPDEKTEVSKVDYGAQSALLDFTKPALVGDPRDLVPATPPPPLQPKEEEKVEKIEQKAEEKPKEKIQEEDGVTSTLTPEFILLEEGGKPTIEMVVSFSIKGTALRPFEKLEYNTRGAPLDDPYFTKVSGLGPDKLPRIITLPGSNYQVESTCQELLPGEYKLHIPLFRDEVSRARNLEVHLNGKIGKDKFLNLSPKEIEDLIRKVEGG